MKSRGERQRQCVGKVSFQYQRRKIVLRDKFAQRHGQLFSVEGYTLEMMLSFAVPLLSAALAGGAENALELEVNQRLCAAWSRAAIQMIAEPKEPTPENYLGALEVARAAVALVPLDEYANRILLEIANVTSGELAHSKAIASQTTLAISKLDPNDSVIRLSRLSEAVDERNTAEDRILAYEHLLQPSVVQKISPVVASRLAYEYSILLRRRGDGDAAVAQFREALKLDPTFPIATAQWAQYQAEINAPPGTIANALVDAIVANPSDTANLQELGLMCLREGLFRESDMLFAVACQIANKNSKILEFDELLMQRMLSLWGLGKHKQVAELFNARKEQLLSILEKKSTGTSQIGSGISLPVAMCVIHAMVSKSGSLPKFEEALKEAIDTFDEQILAAKSDPALKSKLLLEKCAFVLGIGPDVSLVAGWIQEADALTPILPEAKAKFQGWILLRTGKTDEAIEQLKPLAANNAVARLGYGLALAKNGKLKEAENEFSEINRLERNDVIGLYAADQLFELIKSRIAPSAQAAEIQSAVARLPKNFSGLANDSTRYLQVDGAFLSRSVKPFDPMPFKISVTNISPITLAITPDGPIRNSAALLMETIVVQQKQSITNLAPFIFSIARTLQIAPNETMSFVIDIAYLPQVIALLNSPLNGANLQIEMLTNFNLTLDSVTPGFLGKMTAKNSIRILPVIRNQEWREEALGVIRHCDRPDDLVTLVLFAFDLASRSSEQGAEMEVREGWAEVTEAWKRLSPAAQAWTLMVLPMEPLEMTEKIASAAKESQDRRVQLSAILRWTDSENDALLSTLVRGSDEQLIAVASSVRSLIVSRVRDASQVDQLNEEATVLGGAPKPVDVPQSAKP